MKTTNKFSPEVRSARSARLVFRCKAAGIVIALVDGLGQIEFVGG